jgi:hypothetical protein
MPSVNDLVKVNTKEAGTPWFITLAGDGLPRVDLGTYPNKSLADKDAVHVREFLAALLAVTKRRPARREPEWLHT